MHERPSPSKPALHAHVNAPAVFVHVAFAPQSAAPIAHSSTSPHDPPSHAHAASAHVAPASQSAQGPTGASQAQPRKTPTTPIQPMRTSSLYTAAAGDPVVILRARIVSCARRILGPKIS